MAVITGTSGNDTLADTPGNDTINGLGGNDTINGGSGGTDVVDGGDGRDSLQFMTATSAVVVDFVAGTAGTTSFTNIEKVVTGDFNDRLTGDAAAQNLTARAGADTLCGAGGFDTLWGGAGADTFIFRETGSANADNIGDWTSGSDTLLLDGAIMTALGASGDFTAGDARFWSSSTGAAHDADDRILYNTTTRQIFYDADGNGSGAAQLIATLQSGATLVATDILVEGGSNGQVINGTASDDSLVGGPGDDTINGFGGDDTLRGQAGNDSLHGGDGHNFLDAGDGNDTLVGGGSGTYSGGVGNDLLIGGSGDEEFRPGQGNDRVETGAGSNEVVLGFVDPVDPSLDNSEYGNDTLSGGLGDDVLNMFLRSDVVVDMRTGALTGGSLSGGGNVSFSGFEAFGFFADDSSHSVHFTAGDDGARVFANGSGDDTLIGGAGNDRLFGGGGTNLFIGGAGADTMSSATGEGVSTFVFTTAPTAGSADTIFSFVTGVYSLHFDSSVFTALGAAGNFAPNDERFHSANGATQGHDATDRLIYNSANGDLWYDADGNGSGTSVLVATLPQDTGGAERWTVDATDIWVFGSPPSGTIINGTDGDDHLVGTAANDTINGLDGDDLLEGLAGDDELIGGAGEDTLVGGDGNDTLDGGNDSDGHGDEWTADTLNGGLGNDVYYAHAFDTIIDSGGSDTLYTSAMADGFPIDVYTLPAELENLIFHPFEPGFDGEGVRIYYRGNASDNVIIIDNLHESSSSLLDGGAGRDTLDGSGGEVEYIFSVAPGEANADTILGGGSPSVFAGSTLVFDGNAYAGIGPSGSFTANDARFAANSTGTAQDASDRVVYNTSSGQVWYDADGNAAGAAQLVATLQGAPTVAATDIWVVNGQASGEVINGTAADDSLTGTDGNDTINGFGGNDTIHGGEGNDLMDGGSGNDSLSSSPGDNDTLIGGDGNDTLDGATASTFSSNEPGVDTLDGGLGDDLFIVDHASDTVTDAGGVDTVRAVDMGWTLAAGFENLHLNNDERESLVTGIGNALDNFMQGGWFVRLEGLAGDDTLVGTAVEDELLGGDGNDSIFGDQGPDMLDGGAGVDTLDGGFGGNNILTGGSGADIFLFAHAFEDPDTVTDFATGTDRLRFDGGSFTQIGTSGNFVAGDARFSANSSGTAQDASDRLIYNTGTGELWYDEDGNGAAGASLVAALQSAPSLIATDIEVVNGSPPGEVINGTSGNDTLTDTTGHDTINGLGGNDTINGGSGGSDVVDGGTGRDSLMFMAATSAVVVSFGGTVTGGGPGSTSFTNIEKVVTGDFNDRLTGDAAAQNLTARSGMDTLWGGGGVDTLWGGAGADTFIFREHGVANADVVGDWTSGSDTVALENGAFSMIGPDGDFVAGDARFWASSTGLAHDANDRVIYNTSNGQLYYDFDGNGSGAAQLIATLTGSPAVVATDISVI